MPKSFRLAAALVLAPLCALAETAPAPPDLATLLARFDRLPDGPDRAALADQIDAAAHQKYAAVSRLYWHTDLADAEAAAKSLHRPILELRMLGRLDEDLSCANSRFFRATLYANAAVSKLLRDKFVLYWSTERPVPKITIDFGDGRKLEQTTTGNSAHYVLDEDGHVLDVLPGLYAPLAFRTELVKSLQLADRVRGATDDERKDAVVAYHRALLASAGAGWSGTADKHPADDSFMIAERQTVTKMQLEAPQMERIKVKINYTADSFPRDRIAQWANTARALYHIRNGSVLDEQSLALVTRLHADRATQDAMLERLSEHILADTAQNQLSLRRKISQWIVDHGAAADFATLNAWIYENVFHTPANDPWLGLLPRTDFTGLPADGVAMP